MKQIFACICIILALTACHRPYRIAEANSVAILLDSTFDTIQDTTYLAHLAPIKAQLERQLNNPIGYVPQAMAVYRPESPMVNWTSDALLYMARQYCPDKVDMAVVNIGGIRCDWPAGDITFRHVFELMPFDNELVVLTMTGADVLVLCEGFVKARGEGVAGISIKAKNGVLKSAKIAGQDILPEAYYTVATSDYLSQGNDGMLALKNSVSVWKSNKKIRDLYIQYIEEVKTVEAAVDGRMDVCL